MHKLKARGNLWKLSRQADIEMEEKEEEAWRVVGEGALEFTDKEDWEQGYRIGIERVLTRGKLQSSWG